MVAYVDRHHAFLRGALEWKFSHSTYLILVKTLSDLHVDRSRALGDTGPPYLPLQQTARYYAGGTLDVLIQWLVETEDDARAGKEVDSLHLTAALLRLLPSWYTGLLPEDPIPEDLVGADLFADSLDTED